MGVHFSKSNDGTYAIYSTYTDRFLYKNLSYKEVVFYFLENKSFFDVYQMFQFAKNTDEKHFNNNSFEEAEELDLTKFVWDGIKLFRNPLFIEDDKYVIVDFIQGCVPEENQNILTREEAKLYIKEYYYDYYSEAQINRFLDLNKEYGYQKLIKNIVIGKKGILNSIKSLIS